MNSEVATQKFLQVLIGIGRANWNPFNWRVVVLWSRLQQRWWVPVTRKATRKNSVVPGAIFSEYPLLFMSTRYVRMFPDRKPVPRHGRVQDTVTKFTRPRFHSVSVFHLSTVECLDHRIIATMLPREVMRQRSGLSSVVGWFSRRQELHMFSGIHQLPDYSLGIYHPGNGHQLLF